MYRIKNAASDDHYIRFHDCSSPDGQRKSRTRACCRRTLNASERVRKNAVFSARARAILLLTTGVVRTSDVVTRPQRHGHEAARDGHGTSQYVFRLQSRRGYREDFENVWRPANTWPRYRRGGNPRSSFVHRCFEMSTFYLRVARYVRTTRRSFCRAQNFVVQLWTLRVDELYENPFDS